MSKKLMIAGLLFSLIISSLLAQSRDECLAGCAAARESCLINARSGQPTAPSEPGGEPPYTCGEYPSGNPSQNQTQYPTEAEYQAALAYYANLVRNWNTCTETYQAAMAAWFTAVANYNQAKADYNAALANWLAGFQAKSAQCLSSYQSCTENCPEE